jgi:hypothetical protein
MSTSVKVTCPYCNTEFFTEPPLIDDTWMQEPQEIVCVPYTRDVGQFDPKSESDWYSSKGWSRVGKDYLAWLNFERIGILRIRKVGIKVQYRVQRCKACGLLFDVYANYTPGQDLPTLWPHLFEPCQNAAQGEIEPYYGESWLIWIIRHLGQRLRSVYIGSVLVGFLLLLLGLVPDLLHGNMSAGITNNTVIGRIVLYAATSFGVTAILIVGERYFTYMETTHDFEELFKVVNKARNVTHWRNYILCRFVGVQERDKLPKPNQLDVFASGLAILSLLVIWGVRQKPPYYGIQFLLGLIGAAGIALLVNRLQKNPKPAHRARRWILIVTRLLAIGVLVWAITRFLKLDDPLMKAFDLLYWIVVAHILGTATFWALNTSHYILQGIRRIPMNLSPYNRFAQAKPLRVMQKYSTGILVVLFITALAVVSILTIPSIKGTANWLLYWIMLVIAILFVAVGFGLMSGEFLGVTVIYLIFLFLFRNAAPMNFTFIQLPFEIDPKTLIMGLFFTAMIGFQIVRIDGIVNELLNFAKDRELRRLDDQIAAICEQVRKIELELEKRAELLASPTPASTSETIQESSDLQTQRHAALQSIESLMRIKDGIDKIPTRAFLARRVTELATPLVSTFVLPLLSEFIVQSLFS